MSTAAKVMGRVIITWIRDGVDYQPRPEEARFRKEKGATEQILVLRNITEQVIE